MEAEILLLKIRPLKLALLLNLVQILRELDIRP